MIPRDLLPWDAAYRWYATWHRDGTWDRIHDALRDQVRIAGGRDPRSSAAVLDTQSILTSEGGQTRGFDMGKLTRGRRRHIVVDILGLLLVVMVTSASVQDRHGGKAILERLATRFGSIGLVWADAGYANHIDNGLVTWANKAINVVLQIIKRSDDTLGFQVLPRRRVVERTFGCLVRNRRLGRDYERLTGNSETMIKVAMIQLMAKQLAFVSGGKVVSAPLVAQPIVGGTISLAGDFTRTEATLRGPCPGLTPRSAHRGCPRAGARPE